MLDRYQPELFESEWRQKWKDAELFKTRTDPDRPKFYGLDFFPYPSGAGLSVGHCRNYIPTDVLCRMRFMQGFNVLHPMGFDAFGLPAENQAIKTKSAPGPMVEAYGAVYKRQLDLVAVSYDWSRSFFSSDPSYYKWTQWIFEILYNRGLAYQKFSAVNWDPVDKTVVADEEIIGGRAERSGALVEKKYLPQWYFRITEYAQRLIDDLETIDWPEGIKLQQKNWIGKSEGVQFRLKIFTPEVESTDDFAVKKTELSFEVFTTRIDTVFGMTFCVLAPEHPMVAEILKNVSENFQTEVRNYQFEAQNMSDTDRTADSREKTGVFSGAYAVNPANGKQIPIWIADYVLATYGTGAIMAVPGHDERDFAFATKFGIEIFPVIAPTSASQDSPTLPFVSKDGFLINSGEYSGKQVKEAQEALGEWIEALGIGNRKTIYKLRDWLISRQRYWGCPIPVIHSADGETQLVPLSDLPVELPEVSSYEPSGDGSSPLSLISDFVNVTDLDGKLGKRETDTMGGFACSSWYFLRFLDPNNGDAPFDKSLADYWMPVDTYVGGAEHAVMHLLYARFWMKVLYDEGMVSVNEPFKRLQNQGQVLALTPYRKPFENETLGVGEDGILISFEEAKLLPDDSLIWRWARMSKSKGNVVTPEEAVEAYGADALRVYELFVAPFDADVRWSNDGIQGSVRFLNRIFKLVSEIEPIFAQDWQDIIAFEEIPSELIQVRRQVHKTIKKVTENIDRFSFNTYISSLMELLNFVSDAWKKGSSNKTRAESLVFSEFVDSLIRLLAPAAPHSSDELWRSLGQIEFTYHLPWPVADLELTKDDRVTIAVQVNGKLRDTFEASATESDEVLLGLAKSSEKVSSHLEGKTVRKEIVILGKLVNIVAS